MRTPTLSVVIPAFDEQDALPHTLARLRAHLDTTLEAGALPDDYEVIVVDDASSDGTRAVVEQAASTWPQLRLLPLRRNAGHQLAITAGLDQAAGAWAVTIDADLQDPPELIAEMLHRAQADAVDIVYARRDDRSSDTWFKRATAGAYYRLLRRATGVPLEPHVGDFRLMSRQVLDALALLPERGRVLRLLLPYLGFDSTTVGYRREARVAGTTKYPLRKMVSLAWDSATSFGTGPLRLANAMGAAAGLGSVLGAIAVLAAYLQGHTVPGWASIAVLVLFVSAMQFLLIGVLGAYIGRIYSQVQGRPLYDIDERRTAAVLPLDRAAAAAAYAAPAAQARLRA